MRWGEEREGKRQRQRQREGGREEGAERRVVKMCAMLKRPFGFETHLFPGQYNQLSWTTRSTGAKSQGRCTEGSSLPLPLQPQPNLLLLLLSIFPPEKKARTTFFFAAEIPGAVLFPVPYGYPWLARGQLGSLGHRYQCRPVRTHM